jgi:hypothetical protein
MIPDENLTGTPADSFGSIPLLSIHVPVEPLEIAPANGDFAAPFNDLGRKVCAQGLPSLNGFSVHHSG